MGCFRAYHVFQSTDRDKLLIVPFVMENGSCNEESLFKFEAFKHMFSKFTFPDHTEVDTDVLLKPTM